MLDKYPALNLEDTMRIMIRSKPLFMARAKIVQIMLTYKAMKSQIEKFRNIIEKFTTYQILDHEMIEIKDCSDLICQIGHEGLCFIKDLPLIHKFYEGTDFIIEGQVISHTNFTLFYIVGPDLVDQIPDGQSQEGHKQLQYL